MKDLLLNGRIVRMYCTILLLSMLGCGYFSYRAFYVPEDLLPKGQDAITRGPYGGLSGQIGNYEVRLSFWPVWEGQQTRDCFDVNVVFERYVAGLGKTDTAATDSEGDEGEPSIAVLQLISPVSPKIDTLPLVTSFEASGGKSFEFGRVCLPRKYSEIVVRFTALLLAENGESIVSREYEVKLFRWEHRNWLGLE
jgi:hypothetical protein